MATKKQQIPLDSILVFVSGFYLDCYQWFDNEIESHIHWLEEKHDVIREYQNGLIH